MYMVKICHYASGDSWHISLGVFFLGYFLAAFWASAPARYLQAACHDHALVGYKPISKTPQIKNTMPSVIQRIWGLLLVCSDAYLSIKLRNIIILVVTISLGASKAVRLRHRPFPLFQTLQWSLSVQVFFSHSYIVHTHYSKRVSVPGVLLLRCCAPFSSLKRPNGICLQGPVVLCPLLKCEQK